MKVINIQIYGKKNALNHLRYRAFLGTSIK